MSFKIMLSLALLFVTNLASAQSACAYNYFCAPCSSTGG